MFDSFPALAMATLKKFTSFADWVKANGLLNTAKALQMSHRTVAVRIAKPGTFTLPEILLLAEAAETETGIIVTHLAKEIVTSAQDAPHKAAPSSKIELGNNALIFRIKNPETMSPAELAVLAKLSGSDVTTIASQVAAQKAKQPGEPATIAELIHGIGGRYETAEALGMAPNTLATRMKKPEGFTLADLLAVAQLAKVDLVTVTKLAQHQIKNHIAPPTPVVGRPPFSH